MQTPDVDSLRYPIGKFAAPDKMTDALLATWTDDIAQLPTRIRRAVANLSETQLDTPYRPEGWTPGRAPFARQSHECVCTLQTDAHGKQSDHQTLPRRPLGGTRRWQTCAD